VPLVVPGSALGRAFSTIIGSASGLSSNGRSQLWSLAIATFSQHPWLGLGTGSFASLNTGLLYPHNILLEVASELGVFGAAAMVAILIGFVGALSDCWRRSTGPDRLMASLLIALFLTALVNACFSDPIQGNGEVWLWGGLAIGMSARLARRRSNQRRPGTPSPLR
jgi:O-antigen ligase